MQIENFFNFFRNVNKTTLHLSRNTEVTILSARALHLIEIFGGHFDISEVDFQWITECLKVKPHQDSFTRSTYRCIFFFFFLRQLLSLLRIYLYLNKMIFSQQVSKPIPKNQKDLTKQLSLQNFLWKQQVGAFLYFYLHSMFLARIQKIKVYLGTSHLPKPYHKVKVYKNYNII